MTNKELQEALKAFDDDIEFRLEVFDDHTGRYDYIYCSPGDVREMSRDGFTTFLTIS